MTTYRSEDLLVGLISLALLPLIGMRILRGLREGRLPAYRTYVRRDESAAKFAVLMGMHVISFLLVAAIAADLLLSLDLRGAL